MSDADKIIKFLEQFVAPAVAEKFAEHEAAPVLLTIHEKGHHVGDKLKAWCDQHGAPDIRPFVTQTIQEWFAEVNQEHTLTEHPELLTFAKVVEAAFLP